MGYLSLPFATSIGALPGQAMQFSAPPSPAPPVPGRWLRLVRRDDFSRLMGAAIEGIGPVIAASVREFFDSDRSKQGMEKLRAGGVRRAAERSKASGPLVGKAFYQVA